MQPMFLKKEAAISSMNSYGKQQKPFFFMVDHLCNDIWIGNLAEAFRQGILINFNGVSNYTVPAKTAKQIVLHQTAIPFADYKKAFDTVRSSFKRGDTYLLNLTFSTPLQTDHSLEEIFHFAKARYRLLFPDRFVVFSPETFVQIRDGRISTFPMKGTIDASIKDAESRLLNNKKEMAEHATIVDLLRNDMSRVATDVRVERYRYVEKIVAGDKSLLQVSSQITGNLPAGYFEQLGNILFEMLPAGSVTGAPKEKTMEIISKAESHERGFYTGVAGYFDGETLDSCVLIRFIEKAGDAFFYKSGGGLTFQSIDIEEYNEMRSKIYVPTA